MSDAYFKISSQYVVTKNFTDSRVKFFKGERLTYISGGYSRFDDCYYYDFVDENSHLKVFYSKEEYDHAMNRLFDAVFEQK